MSSLNRLIISGNVGNDPEVNHVNGVKVANFSVATTFMENTTWHRCAAWNKSADFVENHVRKGAKITVEGKQINRPGKTKENGDPCTYSSVQVEQMDLHDWLANDEEKPAPKKAAKPKAESSENPFA